MATTPNNAKPGFIPNGNSKRAASSGQITETRVIGQLGSFPKYQEALKLSGIERKASYTSEEYTKLAAALNGEKVQNGSSSTPNSSPTPQTGSLVTSIASQQLGANVSQALAFRLKNEQQIQSLMSVFNKIPTTELIVLGDMCYRFSTPEDIPQETELKELLTSRGCFTLAQMNYKALVLLVQSMKTPQIQAELDNSKRFYEALNQDNSGDFLDVDFFSLPEEATALPATQEAIALPAGA